MPRLLHRNDDFALAAANLWHNVLQQAMENAGANLRRLEPVSFSV
jgi:hypothetical protein